MSYRSRRELLQRVAPRYREAEYLQKTRILDEFVASTGYARKYAIRLLSASESHPASVPLVIRRARERVYGPEVQKALALAWEAANGICSKRLVPFLPELIEILERHGHLRISEETRGLLGSISSATVERVLRPLRSQGPRGISTTRRGQLLKHQIPVRTFADGSDERPGFVEADLVAHGGMSAEGAFLQTLVLTDIATGWTECLPLLFRSQDTVLEALGRARLLLPFPLLGLDTDNGSEFLNNQLLEYCRQEQITFTRGRAYQKNDQCFVEQKNGAIVRLFVGYDRFEGQASYEQLTELYRAVRLYVNYFQPSMKLLSKQRDGAKVSKRYAPAQTPFQRLQSAGKLVDVPWERLEKLYVALDPVRLREQLEQLQDALWQHACLYELAATDGSNKPCGAPSHVAFQHASAGRKAALAAPPDATAASPARAQSQKRKYRRSGRTRAPHTWKTREDPFAEVWEQVQVWLAANPTRTAKSLFQELQRACPDHFADGQLRTLQRRVKAWRAGVIVTFNDAWLEAERAAGSVFPEPLRARPISLEPPHLLTAAAIQSGAVTTGSAGAASAGNL